MQAANYLTLQTTKKQSVDQTTDCDLSPTSRPKVSRAWRREVAAEMVRLDLGLAKAADGFKMCGQGVIGVQHCAANVNHAANPIYHHCMNRGCPDCARTISARLVKRYEPAISAIVAKLQNRKNKLRHLVLTTDIHPNDPDAEQKTDQAASAIDPTIRDLVCPRRPDERVVDWKARWRALKRKHVGALGVSEFGSEGHRLHFHVLYFGPYIPQDRLSEEWERKTGYSVVWISLAEGAEAIREVLKYVTKFSNEGELIAPKLLARIIQLLHGTRRVRSFGLFYNLPDLEIEQNPTDDLEPGQSCDCGACLIVNPVNTWLSYVTKYAHDLSHNPHMPDISLSVIQTLATIGLNSRHEREAGEIWFYAFRDNATIPAMADYDLLPSAERDPP
jgi:hypothetical protein